MTMKEMNREYNLIEYDNVYKKVKDSYDELNNAYNESCSLYTVTADNQEKQRLLNRMSFSLEGRKNLERILKRYPEKPKNAASVEQIKILWEDRFNTEQFNNDLRSFHSVSRIKSVVNWLVQAAVAVIVFLAPFWVLLYFATTSSKSIKAGFFAALFFYAFSTPITVPVFLVITTFILNIVIKAQKKAECKRLGVPYVDDGSSRKRLTFAAIAGALFYRKHKKDLTDGWV